MLHVSHFLPYAVGLYSETSSGPMSIFSGVGGGVTHIMFSGDGNYLFSGGRKVGIL